MKPQQNSRSETGGLMEGADKRSSGGLINLSEAKQARLMSYVLH